MNHLVDLVDDDDNIIGQGQRSEAEAKGLAYRIVHVILRDPQGRILVQWRSDRTKLFKRMFTASAAGGVEAGQSYADAARMEADEEVGVDVPLREIGSFRNTEGLKANAKVFAGEMEAALPDERWKEEADMVDWWTPEEAVHMAERFPYLLTPTFRQSLAVYLKWLHSNA